MCVVPVETMRAFWIDIGYACFGIASDGAGVVREAAPIAAWMIGKKLAEIKPFLLVCIHLCNKTHLW